MDSFKIIASIQVAKENIGMAYTSLDSFFFIITLHKYVFLNNNLNIIEYSKQYSTCKIHPGFCI